MFLGTRSLTLSIGGDDFTASLTNCRLVSGEADSDVTTFADAAAGGLREYRLQGTALQDPSADSLWDLMWTGAGTTVAAILAPNGGPAAATAPSFAGNVVISEPDGDLLGGEANKSASARFTFDIDWVFTAKPVRTFV